MMLYLENAAETLIDLEDPLLAEAIPEGSHRHLNTHIPELTGKLALETSAFTIQIEDLPYAANLSLPVLALPETIPTNPKYRPITQNEITILSLHAQGLSSRDMAERRGTSSENIDCIKHKIRRRLQCQSLDDATKVAFDLGLLRYDERTVIQTDDTALESTNGKFQQDALLQQAQAVFEALVPYYIQGMSSQEIATLLKVSSEKHADLLKPLRDLGIKSRFQMGVWAVATKTVDKVDECNQLDIEIDEQQSEILHRLLQGDSRNAIMEKIGLHSRDTFAKKMSQLKLELRCTTYFQLGLQAARLSLVPLPTAKLLDTTQGNKSNVSSPERTTLPSLPTLKQLEALCLWMRGYSAQDINRGLGKREDRTGWRLLQGALKSLGANNREDAARQAISLGLIVVGEDRLPKINFTSELFIELHGPPLPKYPTTQPSQVIQERYIGKMGKIRSWARSWGYPVGSHGLVPVDLLLKYEDYVQRKDKSDDYGYREAVRIEKYFEDLAHRLRTPDLQKVDVTDILETEQQIQETISMNIMETRGAKPLFAIQSEADLAIVSRLSEVENLKGYRILLASHFIPSHLTLDQLQKLISKGAEVAVSSQNFAGLTIHKTKVVFKAPSGQRYIIENSDALEEIYKYHEVCFDIAIPVPSTGPDSLARINSLLQARQQASILTTEEADILCKRLNGQSYEKIRTMKESTLDSVWKNVNDALKKVGASSLEEAGQRGIELGIFLKKDESFSVINRSSLLLTAIDIKIVTCLILDLSSNEITEYLGISRRNLVRRIGRLKDTLQAASDFEIGEALVGLGLVPQLPSTPPITLTPLEIRLINTQKRDMPFYRAAERLRIPERTLDRHVANTRNKLACNPNSYRTVQLGLQVKRLRLLEDLERNQQPSMSTG